MANLSSFTYFAHGLKWLTMHNGRAGERLLGKGISTALWQIFHDKQGKLLVYSGNVITVFQKSGKVMAVQTLPTILVALVLLCSCNIVQTTPLIKDESQKENAICI